MFITKTEIEYCAAPYGKIAVIPKGTPCEVASNLPMKNNAPQYWVKPWKGMSEKAESWQSNYGFLMSSQEVVALAI